jgi:hypothetical protein
MSNPTLAFSTSQHANVGYARNVGAALRALVTALFAIPASAPAVSSTARVAKAQSTGKKLSLFRLYRMADFDSVSPALVKELQQIASR